MNVGRISCTLLLVALAACGGGEPAPSANAPRLLAAGGPVQGAAAPFIAFGAYRSQYTIVPSANGYVVTDIVSGAAQEVAAASRLRFADTAVALDFNGSAGLAYRLYRATLDREPDLPGLGFHINSLDTGYSREHVAGDFVTSPEFVGKYGSAIGNVDFVTLLYANVLRRAPDAEGLAWHVQHLDGTYPDGITLTRLDTVLNFSESTEFKAAVRPGIASGIEYLPWGSSLPSNPASDYANKYDGTMSGGESGPFGITVGADGAIQGYGITNVQAVGAVGTLPAGGRLDLIMGTSLGQSITLKGSINLATGVAAGTWVNTTSGTSGVFSLFKPAVVVPPPPPLFPQVQTIVAQRCLPCHSASPTIPGFNPAPLGIRFDTEAEIRSRSSQIFSVAVQSSYMPWLNQTGMTQAERDVLAAWFAAGTP